MQHTEYSPGCSLGELNGVERAGPPSRSRLGLAGYHRGHRSLQTHFIKNETPQPIIEAGPVPVEAAGQVTALVVRRGELDFTGDVPESVWNKRPDFHLPLDDKP